MNKIEIFTKYIQNINKFAQNKHDYLFKEFFKHEDIYEELFFFKVFSEKTKNYKKI